MKRKWFQFYIALFTLLSNSFSQVSLQNGSFQTAIPVTNFKDPLSSLSLNLSLVYSSGNGVLVNEMPSCIGEGWNLSGLGVITRIQRGSAPDDQVKMQAGPFEFWYPDGYIFNSFPITNGCNKLMGFYPIFGEEHHKYVIGNNINVDKEQDYFVFSFQGRTGKFVIDKDKNIHILGDSKLKFKQPTFDQSPTNHCRTLINSFAVIDENGIEYEFSIRDYSKLFDYYNTYPIITSAGFQVSTIRSFLKPHQIPDSYNPYVTNNWYLSKITDLLTGRQILIDYKNDIIDMATGYSSQWTLPEGYTAHVDCSFSPGVGGFAIPNGVYNAQQHKSSNISITKRWMFVQKPEPKSVNFPNGDIVSFQYSVPRKDCKGSFKLSDIQIDFSLDGRSEKINLNQSYFVKNEIKDPIPSEENFTRLVLQSVNKISNNEFRRLATFEYYLGDDPNENFVPPAFFHAQDPWGFYNGNYCGIDVSKSLSEAHVFDKRVINIDQSCYYMSDAELLANYNYPPMAGIFPGDNPFSLTYGYMRSNVKTMYAANGLLNTLTNEFGGKTTITYEQNKVDYPINSIDRFAVGGVHVSTVSQMEQDGNQVSLTKYNYTLEDQTTSSLWGAEFPCNVIVNHNSYIPESRNFEGVGCDYGFKYPGELGHVIDANNSTSFGVTMLNLIKTAKIVKAGLNILKPDASLTKSEKMMQNLQSIGNMLGPVIIGILATCTGPYPSDQMTYFTFSNSIQNFQNSLPMQFKRVEVMAVNPVNEDNNGKIVYEFTSPDDQGFELLVPENYFPYKSKPRFYDWAYGLPKSVKIYNTEGRLIKSTENTYDPVYNNFTDDKTKSCNCSVGYSESLRNDSYFNAPDQFSAVTINGNHPNANVNPALFVEIYNQNSGRAELRSTKESVFDKNNKPIETITEFTYNPMNYQVASIKKKTSENKEIEQKIYYPVDFDLPINGANAVAFMPDLNIINVPVATETWQHNSDGSKELLSYNATIFQKLSNADIAPKSTYTLISDRPINSLDAGNITNTNYIRNIPSVKESSLINYDVLGNPVESIDIYKDRKSCAVYGYKKQLPIATISNALRNEVAYTSFENGEPGDWIINLGTVENTSNDLPPTGNWSFGSGGRFSLREPNYITHNQDYILSFWSTDLNINIPQLSLDITEPTINHWKFYQFKVPTGINGRIDILGDGKIDEVRLYPQNARMRSVTYFPSIGKSSECDDNNRIQYFEYDNFGKLKIVRDAERNIIKTNEYHLKN